MESADRPLFILLGIGIVGFGLFFVVMGSLIGAGLQGHNVEGTVGQPLNQYHSDGIIIVNYTVAYVAPGGQTFTTYQSISCSLYSPGSQISGYYSPAFGVAPALFKINPLPKDC